MTSVVKVVVEEEVVVVILLIVIVWIVWTFKKKLNIIMIKPNKLKSLNFIHLLQYNWKKLMRYNYYMEI